MNFSQFLLILKARYKIILSVFLFTVLTTIVVSLLLPKSYEAKTSLVLNYKGVDPVTGLSLPAQLMPGYMATQIDIITSRNVALKVVDNLKFAESPVAQQQFKKESKGKGDMRVWFADLLSQNLNVKPSRESSVIEIAFRGADPEFAAEVANAFALAYQQTNVQLKTEPSQKAAQFLGEQTKLLRKNLEDAQAQLSKYQQEKGLTSVMGNLDVEIARLNDLSSQLVAAQAQAYEAESRQMNTRNNSDASPDVASNPVVQNIKIDIARADSKFSELSKRFGASHPQYQAAKAELDRLKLQLQEEIRRATSSIGGSANIHRQRETEIRAALEAQKKKVLELNLARDELSVLQRDVENAQRAIDVASQRFTQTTLESNGNQTEVAVLNPASVPQQPASPKVLLNTLLAIFMGSLLGVGFGLVAEMTDRRVRSPDDLGQQLGVPVLAVIKARPEKEKNKKNWFTAIFHRLFKSA